jgi:hypothetical protein
LEPQVGQRTPKAVSFWAFMTRSCIVAPQLAGQF